MSDTAEARKFLQAYMEHEYPGEGRILDMDEEPTELFTREAEYIAARLAGESGS